MDVTIPIDFARRGIAMSRYTIGEIAEEFGVSHRTLRFWEERGILLPDRAYGYRAYSDADRQRIQDVLAWSTAGFSIREIWEMLAMSSEQRISHLIKRLPELQSEANEAHELRTQIISNLLETVYELAD